MSDFAKEGERHKPRRRNKDTVKAVEMAAQGDLAQAEDAAPDQPWMEPKPEWVPEVKFIFEAVKIDAMRPFMTPMAWAMLYLKCSAWNREFEVKFLGIDNNGNIKKGKAPIPPAVLADVSKTLDSFGASEKARREMKILIDPDFDAKDTKVGGDVKMAAQKAIARPHRRSLDK